MPSDSGSAEDLLEQVRARAAQGASFDLWVPNNLTMGGSPIPVDVGMAVIGHALLAVRLGPGDFTNGVGGRTYHFKPLE
jgi:hypothetical protein